MASALLSLCSVAAKELLAKVSVSNGPDALALSAAAVGAPVLVYSGFRIGSEASKKISSWWYLAGDDVVEKKRVVRLNKKEKSLQKKLIDCVEARNKRNLRSFLKAAAARQMLDVSTLEAGDLSFLYGEDPDDYLVGSDLVVNEKYNEYPANFTSTHEDFYECSILLVDTDKTAVRIGVGRFTADGLDSRGPVCFITARHVICDLVGDTILGKRVMICYRSSKIDITQEILDWFESPEAVKAQEAQASGYPVLDVSFLMIQRQKYSVLGARLVSISSPCGEMFGARLVLPEGDKFAVTRVNIKRCRDFGPVALEYTANTLPGDSGAGLYVDDIKRRRFSLVAIHCSSHKKEPKLYAQAVAFSYKEFALKRSQVSDETSVELDADFFAKYEQDDYDDRSLSRHAVYDPNSNAFLDGKKAYKRAEDAKFLSRYEQGAQWESTGASDDEFETLTAREKKELVSRMETMKKDVSLIREQRLRTASELLEARNAYDSAMLEKQKVVLEFETQRKTSLAIISQLNAEMRKIKDELAAATNQLAQDKREIAWERAKYVDASLKGSVDGLSSSVTIAPPVVDNGRKFMSHQAVIHDGESRMRVAEIEKLNAEIEKLKLQIPAVQLPPTNDQVDPWLHAAHLAADEVKFPTADVDGSSKFLVVNETISRPTNPSHKLTERAQAAPVSANIASMLMSDFERLVQTASPDEVREFVSQCQRSLSKSESPKEPAPSKTASRTRSSKGASKSMKTKSAKAKSN